MRRILLAIGALFYISLPSSAITKTKMCGENRIMQKPPVLLDLLGFEPSDLTPAEIYVSRLYTHLTGSALPKNHPRFRRALSFVNQNKRFEAARFVTNEENFLRVRARNFAAPMSNKDGNYQEPLNDMQALVIGIIRDELDARLILTGNLRYSGSPRLGLPEPSRNDNLHYSAFETGNYEFARDLERVDDQWSDLPNAAGVFTTRAWSKAHYEANTNRRSVIASFEVFLCAPIDSWKTRGLPDFFVRRDVDRSIGGNPATYQNHCRNCHAPMDAMGGAFAYFDFTDDGKMIFDEAKVAAKMNQNGNVYPDGYVTTDDSWTNLLVNASGYDFGWRGVNQGKGVLGFAQALSNSSAYSRCLVAKVFKEVCGKPLMENILHSNLTNDFEANNYNLRFLFSRIASLNECITY